MNFTVKNIPEKVYEKLKERAERNHRSVNGEIIDILAAAIASRRPTAEEILAVADELRSHTKGVVTDEFIRAAKREGRL